MISYCCPGCGVVAQFAEADAGRAIQCQRCRLQGRVPKPDQEPTDAERLMAVALRGQERAEHELAKIRGRLGCLLAVLVAPFVLGGLAFCFNLFAGFPR